MDRKFYLGLLSLTISAEEELGLSSLTAADKQLLAALWRESNEGTKLVEATYERAESELDFDDFSRAQFYKSVRKLLKLGFIKRVGSKRSATYQLNSAVI